MLELTAPQLNDSLLLSAYDLHYQLLPNAINHLSVPEIIFIDSGGYELGASNDLSAVKDSMPGSKPWSSELFQETLKSIPREPLNLIGIVNYDLDSKGHPLEEQIHSARRLFNDWPQFIHTFLLKPTTGSQQYLPMAQIKAAVPELRGFSIIGVTEDELGNSLLDRITNIADLRKTLDAEGISTPIHVFGSLDPLLTPLYFLAGAEIFDGLSWLRYGYHEGIAIYYQHFSALGPGIQRQRSKVRAQMLINNLNELDRLRMNMTTFLDNENFGVFGRFAKQLEEWYKHLSGRLGGIR
ncbi:MAG TPA: hypothetical protein VJP79_01200 [Nitrososphaera sp.]|nr:hypothetical protein [Nitrososphaera sp.]